MKPGKIVFYGAVLMMAGSAGVSYYNSEEISLFYLKKYYLEYRKETPASMTARAQDLSRQKKYDDVMHYTEKALTLFPRTRELIRLQGLAAIELGKHERGARLVLSALDRSRPSPKELFQAIDILYRGRLYADLVVELSRFHFRDDMVLTTMYGVSLYHVGNYDEAETWLRRARKLGNTEGEVSYYLGLLAERKNRNEEAYGYLKDAYAGNAKHREYREAVVRICKKTGRYDEAARIIGRMRYR